MKDYSNLTNLIEQRNYSLARTIMNNGVIFRAHEMKNYPMIILDTFKKNEELWNFIYTLNETEDTDADMYTYIDLIDGTVVDTAWGYPLFTVDRITQTITVQISDDSVDYGEEEKLISKTIAFTDIKEMILTYDT